MHRQASRLALGLSVLLCASEALAHGDVHEQIQRVSQEIAKTPKDASLYLRRGELFRVHQEYPQALADLERARALDATLPGVELSRGRTLLDAGRLKDARAALDRAVTGSPGSAEPLVWRARTLARLDLRRPAIADYTRTLALAPRSAPEIYLERAELQIREGLLLDALGGLESGIAALGSGGVLDGKAVDVELALSRTDAALARLDRLAAGAARRETFLARRAEVLEAAGRLKDAQAAWDAAWKALETLPPYLRSTRATAALEEKIRSKKDKRS